MTHFRDAREGERLLEARDVLGPDSPVEALDDRLATLMGALSGPTRIRVLFALLGYGELTTGGLAKAVGMSDSATSHQLRVLRDLGLVHRRREGRASVYTLADDHLGVLLKEALYHVDHVRVGLSG